MPPNGRGKPRLSEKEEKWLAARAMGLTPTEAAKVAGYADPYSAGFKLSRNTSLLLMNQTVMAAHGLDLPEFIRVLKDGLSATRHVKATKDGVITDEREVPDFDVRLRYLELGIQLAGLKPSDESKLVKEDEGGTVFMVPDNFMQFSESDLLAETQRRRQALVSGMPLALPEGPTPKDEEIGFEIGDDE